MILAIEERLDRAYRDLTDPSLASGLAGVALFFHQLARSQGEGSDPRARECLERAADALGTQAYPPRLMMGYSGVGWAIDHIEGPDGDTTDEINEALVSLLGSGAWPGEYGLVDGLVGLGVYALPRVGRTDGRALLELVVGQLAERAEPARPGVAWPNEGYHDLGMAHGAAGVVAFFARAAPHVPAAAALVAPATAWLVAQRRQEEVPEFPRGPAAPYVRDGWCAGDPGISVALAAAARRLGDAGLADLAEAVGARSAAAVHTEAVVPNAALCHGHAGRILCRPPTAPPRNLDSLVATGDDPGFLTGLAGIGLVLLSLEQGSRDWASVLLVE